MKLLSKFKVRSNFDEPLKGKVVAFLVAGLLIFGFPSFYLVETRTWPASWLIGLQEQLLGGHLSVSTFVLVMGLLMIAVMLPLTVLAVGYWFLTGKKLLQLFERRKKR